MAEESPSSPDRDQSKDLPENITASDSKNDRIHHSYRSESDPSVSKADSNQQLETSVQNGSALPPSQDRDKRAQAVSAENKTRPVRSRYLLVKLSHSIQLPAVFSILLALVVGAVLVAVTGSNPIEAYAEMFSGAVTGSGLRSTLGRSIPIIGMALAVSLAFRSGVINLGGEGQMILGGLAGTITAIWLPGPGLIVVPIALVVGAIFGAVWALLPAYGQTRLALPILITSLLLNYIARAITGYLVRNPLADVTVTMAATEQVPVEHRIPRTDLFGGVSLTLFLVGLLVIGLSLLYNRTVPGYESKMSGLSGRFARYGGISVNRLTVGVMAGAGAIGGLIGTHLIIGESLRFIDGDLVSSGVAWTGLLVALLAANRPGLILLAGLLFSGLQIGGLSMQRNAGVSWQLAQVIQAVVIIAVASRLVFPSRKGGRKAAGADPTGVDIGQVGEV